MGFSIVVIALLFAYISVLFEPKHVVLDIIYAILFGLMLYGIHAAFQKENEKLKKIKFFTLDSVFVIAGVFSTYTINHLFDISVILASALTGLIIHFLFKKYEAAAYCGSFAGMVSVALFGFFEVTVLAFVCAFIYALISPIFSGYGGKLGTIAFISSLIVHSLFLDEFLVVNVDLHFGFLMLTTILGVALTFYSAQILNVSSVFASALTSALFAILVIYLFPEYQDYAVVFFSASFIGMSSREKLPGLAYVILSGIILGLVYDVFIEVFNGLGGKLGLMAFISVVITTGISKIIIRKKESNL